MCVCSGLPFSSLQLHTETPCDSPGTSIKKRAAVDMIKLVLEVKGLGWRGLWGGGKLTFLLHKAVGRWSS